VLLSLQGTSGRSPYALLALADGTVFVGISIGAPGVTTGEVVFNTAMTGYQEILTDPSYCQQIVTLTYPHIGNYGINAEDVESEKVHAAGLIIKDLPLLASNFRATMTLSEYLVKEGTVAIANIDTRQLTRHLRTKGAQNGCIMALGEDEEVSQAAIDKAIAAAKGAPSMAGLDLAKVVSVKQTYEWTQTEWKLGSGYGVQITPKFHVVAFDFGVKKNILRMMATTFKMKQSHHGANHPVKDLDTGRVSITSQNHGFAVDAASLPANLRATHISLFDGTLQGIAWTDKPAFCFQGHPEASPGPHDTSYLFDRFTALMERAQEKNNA
jgi:carbamoylphosphate synthase small subunit